MAVDEQPEAPYMATHMAPDAGRAFRGRVIMASLYALIATIITVQQTLGKARSNNYAIFKASFGHLMAGRDLYAWYPAEHWDLFKYPPTCALLFAPFAVVPYGVGLWVWNLANAMVLCGAIVLLLPGRAAVAALLIVLLEAFGAIQNTQSNALVAGLMILSVVALEREHPSLGALSIVSGATIKIFPLAAGLFGLLTPHRWRHLLWCIVIGGLFLVAPLLVTTPALLMDQYQSWFAILRQDNTKVGMAWVGGLIELALGRPIAHAPIQLLGVSWIVASAWLARAHWDDARVRHLLVASLLIFSVIFNHMAESPTFVIAYAGIGIWWATMPRARWRDVILGMIILFGSIAGSDVVPRDIRIAYHGRIQLKAIVTVIGWIALQVDLWRLLRGYVAVPPGVLSARVTR